MPATSNHPTHPRSANRSLPRTVSEEEGLVDRRRWTSFLTWAFVLAEVAGRDGFLPLAAHAGGQDATPSSHGSGGTTPLVNNLPNISVSTAAEEPDAVDYQHASFVNLPAPTGLSSELAEAKIAPGSDVLSQGGAGGGAAGQDGGSASVSEVATDASGHISLGAPDLAAFNLTGETFGVELRIDLGDTDHVLFGDLADTLSNLPVVGGLLEDTGNILMSTTGSLVSTLEPIASLVDVDGAPSSHASGFGSPGQLSFAGDSPSAAGHELATPSGGYTNYGIALNLGASEIAHGSGEAAVHADALGVSVLDSVPTDHLPGSDFNIPSDALHLDQSVLRTASDILA